MADTNGRRNPGNPTGWRWLGVFWLCVVSLLGTGAGVVQWLGPPAKSPPKLAHGAAPPARTGHSGHETPVVGVAAHTVPLTKVTAGRATPGPLPDPDPSLQEPAGDGLTGQLPRIAADGRTAMQIYAAGFDHSSRRPRVGVLLAGIGMNEAESDTAIRTLPGAISLAVSPYSRAPGRLLSTARAHGHEYLIALPLEPVGFPLNDPGPETLLTSAAAATNTRNLRWALSRIEGYAGATGIVGTMRGERLAAMVDQMDAVLSELSERGLMYIDPRAERGPVAKTWGRHVDLIVDEVPGREAIDAKLAELEQSAKDHGSALGLIMLPTPVAVARLAAWATGLTDRGLALAPASALASAPADTPVKLSGRE